MHACTSENCFSSSRWHMRAVIFVEKPKRRRKSKCVHQSSTNFFFLVCMFPNECMDVSKFVCSSSKIKRKREKKCVYVIDFVSFHNIVRFSLPVSVSPLLKPTNKAPQTNFLFVSTAGEMHFIRIICMEASKLADWSG